MLYYRTLAVSWKYLDPQYESVLNYYIFLEGFIENEYNSS